MNGTRLRDENSSILKSNHQNEFYKISHSTEVAILTTPELNIEDKTRSNPLPWRGQFSPQLIESHLKNYSKEGDIICDPFVGSGTVLLECGRLGLSAHGIELNPAAATLARTYNLINTVSSERQEVLQEIENYLFPFFDESSSFSLQKELSDLRELLLNIWKIFPEGRSKQLFESLIVLLDFFAGPVSREKLNSKWKYLSTLVKDLPFSNRSIRISLGDARSHAIQSNSIDLVITSPPYINVFNYHQQYRLSMEAMGWNLLSVASSEIGSNRKFRGNRFLTVVQYCLDMSQVLGLLRRVCKEGARIIFIVGRESNVRKTPFYNSDILKELATKCLGLQMVLEQERVFKNRFGEDIFEDILHFKNNGPIIKEPEILARSIAAKILIEAENRAPEESTSDLKDAISKVQSVKPSPLLDLKAVAGDSLGLDGFLLQENK
jgi:DNA modification methylase